MRAITDFDPTQDCDPPASADGTCAARGINAGGTDGVATVFIIVDGAPLDSNGDQITVAVWQAHAASDAPIFVALHPLDGQTLPATLSVRVFALVNGGCGGSHPAIEQTPLE